MHHYSTFFPQAQALKLQQSSAASFFNIWPIKFVPSLSPDPSTDVRYFCHLQYSRVLYALLPPDLKDLPQAFRLEGVDLLFLREFSVSHPYNNTERTRFLKRDSLIFLLILVIFKMLSCIQKDAPAIAILFLISALPQPSLVTLEPMYVELSTPSMSLFPTFRLVSLLILTFSTLQFLALGFKPILAELSSYFVVLCWRWFIEVDNRAMTSAKSRSYA